MSLFRTGLQGLRRSLFGRLVKGSNRRHPIGRGTGLDHINYHFAKTGAPIRVGRRVTREGTLRAAGVSDVCAVEFDPLWMTEERRVGSLYMLGLAVSCKFRCDAHGLAENRNSDTEYRCLQKSCQGCTSLGSPCGLLVLFEADGFIASDCIGKSWAVQFSDCELPGRSFHGNHRNICVRIIAAKIWRRLWKAWRPRNSRDRSNGKFWLSTITRRIRPGKLPKDSAVVSWSISLSL